MTNNPHNHSVKHRQPGHSLLCGSLGPILRCSADTSISLLLYFQISGTFAKRKNSEPVWQDLRGLGFSHLVWASPARLDCLSSLGLIYQKHSVHARSFWWCKKRKGACKAFDVPIIDIFGGKMIALSKE